MSLTFEQTLYGRGCSPGVTIGKAVLFSKKMPAIIESKVRETDAEERHFVHSMEVVKTNLNYLIEKHKNSSAKESIEILQAHQMMLEDPEWLDGIQGLLKQGYNASYSVYKASQIFIEALESLNDPYLRQRANDIRDISQRVLEAIAGIPAEKDLLKEPSILVAKDLLPSEFLSLDLSRLRGLVLEGGSPTSHTSILAKTFEIPLVVGVKDLLVTEQKVETIAINGLRGSVTINPTQEQTVEFKKIQDEEIQQKQELNFYINQKSKTIDGHTVEIAANLSSLMDLDLALKKGTEGSGLFRTEFLLFDRPSMPTEAEQFNIYKTALEKLAPNKAVIRTFDIGGDKKVPYLNLPKEDNPFLGLRGLRLCLKNLDLFIPQLRALLRASIYGKLCIMAPMVTTIEEVFEFKKLIMQTIGQLKEEGHTIADNIEIGIMIEVPAAVMIAGHLAKHVDFFSVGTNDLIQYLCATDRMNESVSELHDPYHPGVLKTLKVLSQEVAGKSVWLGMCGELAAQADYAPLLLALGFKELSVSPGAILKTRKAVNSARLDQAHLLLEKALLCESSAELKKLLTQ